jgi:hypothetical protein
MKSKPIFAAFGGSWAKVYTFVLTLVGLHQWSVAEPLTFFGRLKKLKAARGAKGAGAYLKESQRALLKWLAGAPLGKGKSTVRLKKGVPAILPGALRKAIYSGNLAAVRVALTLFGVSRTIFHKGAIKTSTITEPSSWAPSPSREATMSKRIKVALKWLKVGQFQRPTKVTGLSDIVKVSNRQGPNGHAVLAAHWDAYALRHSSVWTTFSFLAKAWGLPFLIHSVEALSLVTSPMVTKYPIIEKALPQDRAIIGKLGVKKEPLGKMRVFAISDFWTQTLLRPFHNFLMGELRKLPMDGTWDQGKAADRVREETKKGTKLYSFDLSAATDRFPVRFLVLVLTALVGPEVAEAWRILLVDRDYWHAGVAYRYAAGQPMGTLSSWASFALAHHVVVQMAARLAGYEGLFQGYVLLGDDIVIFDEAVAEEYRLLMTELGVTINDDKSINGPGTAEFAKRIFHGGSEVTGVSGAVVAQAVAHLSGLRVLVETLLLRGFCITHQTFYQASLHLTIQGKMTRAWRYILASLLGPEAPLAVQPALWGGLMVYPLDYLLGMRSASRLPGGGPTFTRKDPSTAEAISESPVMGPLPCESGALELEILRYRSFTSIRRARESQAKWIETLSGNLVSLLKGWVLMSPKKESSGANFQLHHMVPAVIGWARELIEVGHPAQAIALKAQDQTDHSEWELADLSIPLSEGDWLQPTVWGLAPSGDMRILVKARRMSHFAIDVARACAATLPLAFEWQEPGALEMIREGWELETLEFWKDLPASDS